MTPTPEAVRAALAWADARTGGYTPEKLAALMSTDEAISPHRHRDDFETSDRAVIRILAAALRERESIIKDCLDAMPCTFIPGHVPEKLAGMITDQVQSYVWLTFREEKLEACLQEILDNAHLYGTALTTSLAERIKTALADDEDKQPLPDAPGNSIKQPK